MTYKLQDPGDSLSYSHDWSDFLAEGDDVDSRQWTIDPDDSPSHLTNATSAVVTVANLTAGEVYRVSEDVVTDAGVRAGRAFTIRCEER